MNILEMLASHGSIISRPSSLSELTRPLINQLYRSVMTKPRLPENLLVKRINTPEEFWGRVDQSTGVDSCWIWTKGKNDRGYGLASYQGLSWKAHRLAALLSGMVIDDLCVLHKCDNPPCVNPSHLFVGTRGDNNRDTSRKGRMATGDRHWTRMNPESVKRGDMHYTKSNPELVSRGEANGMAKLRQKDVEEIRFLRFLGLAYPEIASHYGVYRSTIQKIITRKTWCHIA